MEHARISNKNVHSVAQREAERTFLFMKERKKVYNSTREVIINLYTGCINGTQKEDAGKS